MGAYMEIVFPGGKKVNALFKQFTIQTDQHKANGGDESAPTPFELFQASMGTCAGIYVLEFFQTRGLSTEGLRIMLHREIDSERKKISKMTLEIVLPKGFPEKYLKAVIRAAEQCSVARTLADPFPLEVIATQQV